MDGNPLNTSFGNSSSIIWDKETLEKERLKALVIRQASSSELEWNTTSSSLCYTQRLTSSPLSLSSFSPKLPITPTLSPFSLSFSSLLSFSYSLSFVLFSFSTVYFILSILQSNSLFHCNKFSAKVGAHFSCLLGLKIPCFISSSPSLPLNALIAHCLVAKSYQIASQMPP